LCLPSMRGINFTHWDHAVIMRRCRLFKHLLIFCGRIPGPWT
jgi:hypothetical protein